MTCSRHPARAFAALILACACHATFAADATPPPATPAAAAQAAVGTRERAIFAVSDADPQKWALTLGNIANALDALGADADIELVAYGPGIAMLKKDSPVADRLAAALAKGVRIAACQHSMQGAHLALADLVPGAVPVPSGVVELIRREHDGYAYVRS
jgi:intracellular sulfur oxidation DsrE/DsrF family protein